MKKIVKAHLMLLTTSLIGGFNYSISKIIMPDYAKPMSIVVVRGIVTLILYSIVHFLFIKESIEKKDYGRIFLAALFGITINQITFYEGLNLTKPINASLMMTVAPIMVLLIAVVLKKENFTLLKAVGVALGTIGSGLLLIKSGKGNLEGLFIGDILILINAICWACYLVTIKPLVQKYHPLTILKWLFLIGMLFIFPYGYNDFTNTNWGNFTQEIWWALAFIILFATILSYFLNTSVLKYVNPSLAGSYIYIQPILATLIAVAWGLDNFSLEKLGYLILIFSGVYMVSFKK